MDDPNADLIGQTVTQEGRNFTIVGSAPWSNAYVYGESEDETVTCFVASHVRLYLACPL